MCEQLSTVHVHFNRYSVKVRANGNQNFISKWIFLRIYEHVIYIRMSLEGGQVSDHNARGAYKSCYVSRLPAPQNFLLL